jgi:uncharacterized membrane protein YidH (DUF202 family)
MASSAPRESEVPHGYRPNSDDDDDDDVRLVRQHSHTSAGAVAAAAGHHRDGPSITEPPSQAPSSSKAKAVDDPAVSAAPAGGAAVPPFSLSLTLRNTGSVARDHLASERTFLAYVRTSLSFASAGVGPSLLVLLLALTFFLLKSYIYIYIALVQLFRVSVSASVNGVSSSHADVLYASYARPLGATLVGFGMAVLVIGEPSVLSLPFPSPFSSPHAPHTHAQLTTRTCSPPLVRHSAIFSHPASAAPGTLPRSPPQRVSAGGVSRDSGRNRLWNPRRGALSWLRLVVRRRGADEGARLVRPDSIFTLPLSLHDHPSLFFSLATRKCTDGQQNCSVGRPRGALRRACEDMRPYCVCMAKDCEIASFGVLAF